MGGRSQGALRAALDACAAARGLVVDDLTVRPGARRGHVTVTVDLPDDAIGSVDADLLAEVSRDISGVLDVHEPMQGAYNLEVTTPGIGRPLTLPRHFMRARTRLVVVTLTDGSQATGRLNRADDESIELVDERHGGPSAARTIALRDVVSGAVQVELRRAAEGE